MVPYRTLAFGGIVLVVAACAASLTWRQKSMFRESSPVATASTEGTIEVGGGWSMPSAEVLGGQRKEVSAYLRSLSPAARRAGLAMLADALRGLDARRIVPAHHGLAHDLATLAYELDDLELMALFYEFASQPAFPDALRFRSLSQLGWVYLYSAGDEATNHAASRSALEEALSIADTPPAGLLVRPEEHLDILRKLAFLDSEAGDAAGAFSHYSLAIERIGDQLTLRDLVQLMKDTSRQAAKAGDTEAAASLASATLDLIRSGGEDQGEYAHWAAEMVTVMDLQPPDPRYSDVLERVVLDPQANSSPSTIITRVMLARSYEAQGLGGESLILLGETYQRFGAVRDVSDDLVWPYDTFADAMATVGLELSRSLRKSGATEEAGSIEAEVLARYPHTAAASAIRARASD
ncbi:MAG: hypothetical protein KF838_13430 [Phycisphaeraceae bacterium]|nr:MAG: hypothetical protein KF838_13430 [Phycisphaeraceae bacterium]